MYFETLEEALAAEDLQDLWAYNFPFGETSIEYGGTFRSVLEGLKGGWVRVTIYRHDETGRYERPVHYRT